MARWCLQHVIQIDEFGPSESALKLTRRRDTIQLWAMKQALMFPILIAEIHHFKCKTKISLQGWTHRPTMQQANKIPQTKGWVLWKGRGFCNNLNSLMERPPNSQPRLLQARWIWSYRLSIELVSRKRAWTRTGTTKRTGLRWPEISQGERWSLRWTSMRGPTSHP